MGTARGIAGSMGPELEGIFLSPDIWEATFFVEMGARRHGPEGIDVWEVHLDLEDDWDPDADERFGEIHGFLYYNGTIAPSRLRLLDDDLFSGGSVPAAQEDGAQIKGGFTITTRNPERGD